MTFSISESLHKITSTVRTIDPYVRGFSIATGWIVAGFLMASLLGDWGKALKFPAPHQYGEGVLVWMTKEIDAGHWPYGEILGTPSRYSCYAPLAPTLAALVSKVTPGEGERYVQAGRVVNYSAWLIAAFLIACASSKAILPRIAIALMFLSAISLHSFFWTFRVDSTVMACQALVLFVLVRCPPRRLSTLLPLSVVLLTLAKPPAALDLIPIGLLAMSLRQSSPLDFIKMTLRPAIYSIVLAPTIFFGFDVLSGMKMSNNILWEQLGSGSIDPEGFSRNLYSALLPPAMWPTLIWASFAFAAFAPSGRLKLAAIAISLLFCTAFSTKNGADTNYYFPLIMILVSSAGSYLRLSPGHATFIIIALTALTLPLDPQPSHRKSDRQKADITYRVDTLKTIHDQENFLSDDPFFSVLAGRDPLVTDIFQLTLATANARKSAEYLSNTATGAWGGFRLKALMARGEDFSLEENAVPMAISYAPDAVWVKDISKAPPLHPPMEVSWSNVRQEFLKKGVFTSLFLFLLALVPTRCFSDPTRGRPPR